MAKRVAEGFPMAAVRIVARDLVFVEQVVSRITLRRAAIDGAWSGALVGAFIGLFFGLFDWFAPSGRRWCWPCGESFSVR